MKTVRPDELFSYEQWTAIITILKKEQSFDQRVKALRPYLDSQRASLEAAGLLPEFGAYWIAHNANAFLEYDQTLNAIKNN